MAADFVDPLPQYHSADVTTHPSPLPRLPLYPLPEYRPPVVHPADIAKPPCLCYTDPYLSARRLAVHPLLAAGFHNLTCSPLCRLPEDLLIAIMLACDDPVPLLVLRRSSRLFLRLFESPAFRQYWASSPPSGPIALPALPWTPPRHELLGTAQAAVLRQLLHRDAPNNPHLCDTCRFRQRRADWPARVAHITKRRLFCSECSTTHPASCFSATQRRAPVRVCIGRQGHVRLCQHVALSWETVSALVPLARTQHPHDTLLVAECRHPSHLPAHATWLAKLFGWYDYPRALLSHSRRCEETGPSPPVRLRLHYVGHARMPCPDAGQGRFTPDVVARQFSLLRQDVGRYIAPQVTPGVLPEMLAFALNSCTCLKDPGMEYRPSGWRLSGISYPRPKGRRARAFPDDEPEDRRRLPTRHCSAFHAQEMDMDTRRSNATTTISLTAILPCWGDSECSAVSYTRSLRVTHDSTTRSDVTADWQQAVDPESYLPIGSASDHETQGILWCPNTSCLNHHRFTKPLRVWQ
ncbi:hypothetical protein QBC39DRAFT_299128 [Podospora conica]|nr:hypothetical protein QBC39DRAFT_299128 [Schizothecium conicum]